MLFYVTVEPFMGLLKSKRKTHQVFEVLRCRGEGGATWISVWTHSCPPWRSDSPNRSPGTARQNEKNT